MGNSQTTTQESTPPAQCPVQHGKGVQPAAAPSKCPVQHGKSGYSAATAGDGAKASKCPVKHSGKPSPSSGCPVSPEARQAYNVYSQPIDPKNQMPFNPNQQPAEGQEVPLSVERTNSTIPKGESDGTWTYPSQQMFFNALNRKGKGADVEESDMAAVVAFHNNMNERTWNQLLRWEALHKSTCPNPSLLKFQGRPDDLSPKARLKHMLGMAPKPFDRHDWTVDRCGVLVRYIIDFYDAEQEPTEVPSLHTPGSVRSLQMDVRPALDSLGSVWDRLRMNVMDATGNAPQGPTLEEQSQQSAAASAAGAGGAEAEVAGEGEEEFFSPEGVARLREAAASNCQTWIEKVANCEEREAAGEESACAAAAAGMVHCMGSLVCPQEAQRFREAMEREADSGESEQSQAAFDCVQECLDGFEQKLARSLQHHAAQAADTDAASGSKQQPAA